PFEKVTYSWAVTQLDLQALVERSEAQRLPRNLFFLPLIPDPSPPFLINGRRELCRYLRPITLR
ncbi:hypothetical protein ACHMWS_17320, partial [Aeromonas caviae]|uniref:hypothetical protein n=1 Tax=Aeromonas caviae TaxID=648 RepID=UPI0037540567